MSLSILLSIYSELLSARRVTAPQLAEKHEISTRSVYRYVAALSTVLPLFVRRGRRGGIFLSDAHLLPTDFLTEGEYEALSDALLIAYERFPEERFLAAKRKLSAPRTEPPSPPLSPCELRLLPNENTPYAKTLRTLQTAVAEKRVARLLYGEKKAQLRVEPHALLFENGEWYAYAFCYGSRRFEKLAVREAYGVSLDEDTFRPRDF